ncbi:MAG: zinc metallopeptidase [Bacteroidota bacterium]|nr:zinc metallopeptidase [Bacteroidota bacterium]
MSGFFIIAIVVMLVSMFVSNRLKSKFEHYSKVRLQNNMSGAEVAARMLADNGIRDVKIQQVNGKLTDHYNPLDKTVNLSESVYHERNAAAAAVAAHECGHAIQHAEAYAWLGLRSKLVPAVNVSARVMQFANMIMLVAGGAMFYKGNAMGMTILLVLIAANVFLTVFAMVTLPVEFDASKRALAWMRNNGIVTSQEYEGSKDSLKWAAMTYVVAAMGALANLMYFLSIFLGRRD